MKIHEYQGKEIFRSTACRRRAASRRSRVDEAVQAAKQLGGTGLGREGADPRRRPRQGRRRQGRASSIDEVRELAGKILGMQLVTHQTGPEGQKVRRLLIEEGADIEKELYVGMVVDRATQRVALMASSEGGMDIEEVAAKTPEKIHQGVRSIRSTGLTDAEARRRRAQDRHSRGERARRRATLLQGALPAASTRPTLARRDQPADRHRATASVIALDAKINFDDNALFRHPDIVAMRDLDEEDPPRSRPRSSTSRYISLDGNIGCLVNGAGLAMATMDIIKLYGGEPANFLDVGGGATTEKVTEAFKIILRNPKVKAILVNIFGGIMKCDMIAERRRRGGARRSALKVPLVVRLEGHQRGARAEDPRRLGPADHHGATTWPRRRRRSSPRRRESVA